MRGRRSVPFSGRLRESSSTELLKSTGRITCLTESNIHWRPCLLASKSNEKEGFRFGETLALKFRANLANRTKKSSLSEAIANLPPLSIRFVCVRDSQTIAGDSLLFGSSFSRMAQFAVLRSIGCIPVNISNGAPCRAGVLGSASFFGSQLPEPTLIGPLN